MNTDNWLERTELLLGKEKLDLLRKAHVLVVGLGGVGAYAAEMIVRAGVGRMTIADADAVAPSNINRQLVALHSTVGRQKAEILAERLRDINPEIATHGGQPLYQGRGDRPAARRREIRLRSGRHRHPLAQTGADKGCFGPFGMPLVSSMGAGAKTDPTKMEIADIVQAPTTVRWPTCCASGSTKSASAAVSGPSTRPNLMREGALILCEEQNKKSNVGTISYIPALFGIGCASVVIRGLIGRNGGF